jgi:hypothetical protein
MARVPVTDAIRREAQALLDKGQTPGIGSRAKLKKIASGEMDTVDFDWWYTVHLQDWWQLDRLAHEKDKDRRKALEARADPARGNAPNEIEKAKKALANFKPTKSWPSLPPALEPYQREHEQRIDA